MTGTGTEQVAMQEVSIVRTTRRARARRVLSTILSTRRALVGLILVLSMVIVSAFAPIIAPYDPVIPDHGPQFAPPGWEFPFGTDDFGRDVLSRVIWGGRKALVISLAAVLLAMVAGGVLGLVAGFVGRRVDQLIMRLVDILQAIPWLVMALMVVAFLGPGVWNVIFAIALPGVPGYARLVRSAVLEVREQDYVTAARAIGDGPVSIMVRQVLANSFVPVLVVMTLGFGNTLIAEAGLSFVGLGTQPPEPSWGRMLSESRSFISVASWTVVFPGLAISWGVIGFNILGDGLRDALDPRMRDIR
ncbi:MAG: ABC transporter permease [bacterium]|nr:ABC transporter permease [bacterium]MDE0287836.1 ABC transporter permease [bacterium]MDE0438327.1 ABC transporter permease [bacterium]